jgi:hypothetical protein
MISITPNSEARTHKRKQTKGRKVAPAALLEVRASHGDVSFQKDQLIEHLHTSNDQLGDLPQKMRVYHAEFFESASCYQNFTITNESIFKSIENSAPRSLAGADFPARRKWRIVA